MGGSLELAEPRGADANNTARSRAGSSSAARRTRRPHAVITAGAGDEVDRISAAA
jgi:hypothetical protein